MKKQEIKHFENARNSSHETHLVGELGERGFAAGEADELPKGYFYSPFFLGTIVASGFNFMAASGGFALVAPVLTEMSISLGPSVNIIWLSLVYTLGVAVGITLVGRISDTFGRRWMFIGGTSIGCIGAIVCSTAKNIPVLIIGQALIGLSSSTGYSFAFVIGELVPVKYRTIFASTIVAFSLPTKGFGAVISTLIVFRTRAGWRGVYYLLIFLNGLTVLLYAAFYFPPTFQQKHGRDPIMKWLKNFDYGGLVLYTAGLVLFILGLSSGGSLYPWTDSKVIGPIVIGIVCLVALFVYESYVELEEPLIPMHLFKNRGWVASVLSQCLDASVYYSQATIWPAMTINVYARGRIEWAGIVSCIVGMGIVIGSVIGGVSAKAFGHWKFQSCCVVTLGTLFLGLGAVCNPNTPNMAITLVFLATTFLGWNQTIVSTIGTIAIRDQREIGTATGIAGSTRSAISTIASAIYSAILTMRTKKTLTAQIPPAVIGAGLPTSSVDQYMAAIAAGGTENLLAAVPGLTPEILATGTEAYRWAYANAYRTIFLTSLSFGGLGIICSFFLPNMDTMMGGKVAVKLTGREKEREDIDA